MTNKILYMCKVDYDHELGEASGGVELYSSEQDLRNSRKCVDQCGIVKVKVELVEVVQEEDFSLVGNKSVEKNLV